MSERFRVEIFGQTYFMQGELDAAYVEQLAAYVDEKMRTISANLHVVENVRVAVLAALSIADELHTLRKSQQEMRGALRDRAERCLTLVERALKQTA
jgi:cell division protein ZapA